LRAKANRLKDEARQTGYSQALVRVADDVEASLSKEYPSLGKSTARSNVGDYGAYQRGKEAGNRASIGDTHIGGGRQQLER
jgi:hypothetical protein